MSRRSSSAVVLAASVALLAAPGTAAAESSTDIRAAGTMLSATSVSATRLDFGAFSPTMSMNTAAQITVTATQGTTYDIQIGPGNGGQPGTRAMKPVSGSADSVLEYDVYRDAGRSSRWGSTVGTDTVSGSGTGQAQTYPVYGRIPPGQWIAPGDYGDTLTVTIVY